MQMKVYKNDEGYWLWMKVKSQEASTRLSHEPGILGIIEGIIQAVENKIFTAEETSDIKLSDIIPKKAEIEVKGKKYTLNEYTLFAKAHFVSMYGEEGFKDKLSGKYQEILLSEIAYFLIDEQGKKDFPTLDDFRKSVVGLDSELQLIKAVYQTIGISTKTAIPKEKKIDKK